MASNSMLNRIQILFYSILIGVLSGINHLRSFPEPQDIATAHAEVMEIDEGAMITGEAPGITIHDYLRYTQQALSSLMVWIVLGFATGFLAGLINFR